MLPTTRPSSSATIYVKDDGGIADLLLAPTIIAIGATIAIVGGGWLLVLHLASPNRGAEDIRILPVVVAEPELGDVQRQVIGADLVERANDAALNQRPEPSIVLEWMAPIT